MKVQELEATAFKGVRHVNIKPGGLVVAITGRNGQGKSSVLDALQWAIGGAKFAPETPVRKGNQKTEVSVDLGELRITRTQTAKGSMSLTVTTRDGVPIAQANWAEQIKASVALAAAVSPKLKVALVREGSALDADNQKALEEAATAAGLQVWIERVTNGEHVGITIVDGEVEGAEGGAA